MTKDYIIKSDGIEPFTMKLDPAFYADWALLQAVGHGAFPEPEVSALMVHVIKPGDTVIDVGANTGFYTCLLARLVGPTGTVIAFEPGTNNLPHLKENIAVNKFENVTIHEKAAWSECGFTKFYLNADSGQNALWSFPYSETVEVEVTTLDGACLGLSPKLAKIDVEGAEEHVLRGMCLLLAKGLPQFVTCEINAASLPMLGSSEENLRQIMRGYGYDTFSLPSVPSMPTLIPPKTKVKGRQLNTNILFAKLDTISEYWPEVMVGPTQPTMRDALVA